MSHFPLLALPLASVSQAASPVFHVDQCTGEACALSWYSCVPFVPLAAALHCAAVGTPVQLPHQCSWLKLEKRLHQQGVVISSKECYWQHSRLSVSVLKPLL